MTHEPGDLFLENIPAYALGALDADESRSLEAHLQICPSCRAEFDSYRQVGDNLLLATPPQPPPAELRTRLQARLPSAQKTTRRRFTWSLSQFGLGQISLGQLGLAAAIVLLLVLNIFSFLQVRSLQSKQEQLARHLETSQTALAMLTYPDTQTLSLEGTGVVGTLLLDKDRNVALLTVWHLPHLQADQTYQIWLIDPQGARTSAGIFQPESELPFTSTSIYSSGSLANYVGIGVTVEPAGGSDQPTGERIFKVDF